MRAARIHEHGDPDVIRIDEIPRPAPGPGQVLVEVAATSFNPTEVALRSGVLRELVPVTLPLTLGWDVAGTVVELGAGVDAHAIGDRVIGWIDGAAAEFAVADADALVAAPRSIALADAAALPLAGLTAWQAIEQAGITAGERVLVNGAGGGIGGFTVQLARKAGARVIATAGPRSAAKVRELGAEQLIDYTATTLDEALDGPVDLVLHLVGLPDAAGIARLGGRIVSVTNKIGHHVLVRNDSRDLAALVALVDDGSLALDITERHALADLPEIHRRSERGDLRGKVLVLT
ncbi:NADP-dependent oxidoreductase [Amycolatopsis sp. 195334CR]|uniref:NADP-dependent oxidoreductase n=1 Tax=Amycolatopsis sp. 195334CR TaxID=2814588 RepID=UPI001A8FBD63|nr:NADP-dependent oxidoreductase [Amycolatopsis sp. 195334CR]MBN6040918.1 NADP-dependent oxidoreductase [Amycolatopsis sp. 195334CR]